MNTHFVSPVSVMHRPLVLVDENDNAVGVGDKELIHRSGQLHRAFSVFVFDETGRMLLQQRAHHKYHSGGLWSNTCCSHPGPEETVVEAAKRRLQEEMGFSCPLRRLFEFVYRAHLDNGLVEHEYDHVLVGRYSGEPAPDPEEVAAWKWVEPRTIAEELDEHSERYSYWFEIAFRRLMEHPPAEMQVGRR